MFPESYTDEQLHIRLDETRRGIRELYLLKDQIVEELERRHLPEGQHYSQPDEQPKPGLTYRQISQIREWAKKPHSTDDLIKFIQALGVK